MPYWPNINGSDTSRYLKVTIDRSGACREGGCGSLWPTQWPEETGEDEPGSALTLSIPTVTTQWLL